MRARTCHDDEDEVAKQKCHQYTILCQLTRTSTLVCEHMFYCGLLIYNFPSTRSGNRNCLSFHIKRKSAMMGSARREDRQILHFIVQRHPHKLSGRCFGGPSAGARRQQPPKAFWGFFCSIGKDVTFLISIQLLLHLTRTKNVHLTRLSESSTSRTNISSHQHPHDACFESRERKARKTQTLRHLPVSI